MSSIFPPPGVSRLSTVAAPPKAHYDLAWLGQDGLPQWQSRVLPVSQLTEAACAVIARGALVDTRNGPKAVEDLIPGDVLRTLVDGWKVLRWIGARTYPEEVDRPALLRVGAGAFGRDAPHSPLVLSLSASVLIERAECMSLVGQARAFAPLAAFEDGLSISRLHPPGELTLYSLAFDGQEAVALNGLAVETYHPGRHAQRLMNAEAQTLQSRLFPHIHSHTGFASASIPGLTMTEARLLSHAHAS